MADPAPVPTVEVDPLVMLIRSQPGMAQRLVTEHSDDGTRHCRRCTGGGQSGRNVWPCQLFLAAAHVARGRG